MPRRFAGVATGRRPHRPGAGPLGTPQPPPGRKTEDDQIDFAAVLAGEICDQGDTFGNTARGAEDQCPWPLALRQEEAPVNGPKQFVEAILGEA